MIIQNNDVYSIGNVSGTHDILPLGTYRQEDNHYIIRKRSNKSLLF